MKHVKRIILPFLPFLLLLLLLLLLPLFFDEWLLRVSENDGQRKSVRLFVASSLGY